MKPYYALIYIAFFVTPLIVGCNDKGTVINEGALVEMIRVETINGEDILLEKQSIERKDPDFFSYDLPKDKVIVEGLQKSISEREDGSTSTQYTWISVDCSDYSFLVTSGNLSTGQVMNDMFSLERPYHYEDFVPISSYDNRFKKTVKVICANYNPEDKTEF